MIAFDGNAAGHWDIYVIASTGGRPVRVTNNGGNNVRPSWSRDGKWLYYCSTRTGLPQVWKIHAGGDGEVQVTKGGGGVAFESVDGQELYYTKDDYLWKIPVQGGPEVKILGPLLLSCFAPATRGLYFIGGSSSSDPRPHLKFMDFATGNVRVVSALDGDIGDELSLSPDERSILIEKTDRVSSELMIVENFH
jgi:hypothetical protein